MSLEPAVLLFLPQVCPLEPAELATGLGAGQQRRRKPTPLAQRGKKDIASKRTGRACHHLAAGGIRDLSYAFSLCPVRVGLPRGYSG